MIIILQKNQVAHVFVSFTLYISTVFIRFVVVWLVFESRRIFRFPKLVFVPPLLRRFAVGLLYKRSWLSYFVALLWDRFELPPPWDSPLLPLNYLNIYI